jgi:hypothetical protein
MTASKPSGEQPPEDDTALLTAALDHTWAWYDGRSKHATQTINYYLVATAILFTAYTNAIGKYWGVAVALAIAGILLTLLGLVAVLHQVNGAYLAEAPLSELQDRIAGKLKIDAIRMARLQAGIRQRRAGVIVTFSGVVLFDIAGLAYAATR